MPPDYSLDIEELENKYELPKGSLKSLVQTESAGNPNAKSKVGAFGLTQLMPETAKELGVDPADPKQNLEGGAKYLAQNLKQFGSLPLAYAAYNAGPGRVKSAGNQIPNIPETQDYVSKNMKNMSQSLLDKTPPTGGIDETALNNQAAPQPVMGAPSSLEQPAKKSWKDKILPLVFRIGLPTIAGGVMGARDPFRGGFASALTGAASGGLGYLNEADKEKAAAMEIQKTQARADAEAAAAKAKADQLDKTLGLQTQKLQYDQQYNTDRLNREREQDKVKNNLERLEYERKLAKDRADALAKTEKDKTEKMNPEDKIYKFLSDQMGGQTIDPKNQKQVQSLIDNLQTKNIKDLMKEPGGITGTLKSLWSGESEEPNPDKVNAYISSYNSYVNRGKGQAGQSNPAPGKPPNAVGKAKDESGQIWWTDQNGKAISKVQ